MVSFHFESIAFSPLSAAALERSGGNRSQAAKLLEISYKALLYKIRDYELEEA